jgi:hypothetical protein
MKSLRGLNEDRQTQYLRRVESRQDVKSISGKVIWSNYKFDILFVHIRLSNSSATGDNF